MAIAAATVWEVRTTGADTNGGGFVAGAAGVDYSQQAAAQYGAADLVVDAVSNTKVTSASHNFDADDVGNLMQITAGAGFSTGFYQIVSVASNAATLDRSPAATGTTGGTYAVGGALLTIGKLVGNAIAGNTAWIKAGTYTLTASIAWTTAGTLAAPIRFRGYTSTRGDSSTKPLITTATNSTVLWTVNNAPYLEWRNLSLSNTAGTRAAGIQGITNQSAGSWTLKDCVLDGFSTGLDTTSRGANSMYVIRTLVKNCTGSGMSESSANFWVILDSVFYNNGVDGLRLSASAGPLTVRGCIFANNTVNGLHDAATARAMTYVLDGNTFVQNGGAGFKSAETSTCPQVFAQNNIFYANGTYGLDFAFSGGVDPTTWANISNAYGSNSSGPRNGMSAGTNDVTLTADPFTAKASQDWTLNITAGGGALCRLAGYPGALPLGGTGYLDIGALQARAGGVSRSRQVMG